MKKQSKQSFMPITVPGKFIYLVWTGPRDDIIEWAHSKEGEEALYPMLHAGKVARIWCPLDGDSIVTLKMQKVGQFVMENGGIAQDVQAPSE